jgi:hypothetical protein
MMRGLALTASLLAAGSALAQTARPASPAKGWQAGAVLDVAAQSNQLALGARDKGLSLGHSDLSAYGPLGPHLEAQITAAAHSHDKKLELELEEAWFQTRTLPGGLQLRAGRFPAQMGYLNEQHPHADDFVERPLLYRAFLGGHYNDEGLRFNWVAPTDLYLRLGAEVFRGKTLVEEAASAGRPGVTVLSARLGGDIGRNHSWQADFSYLRNKREAAVEDEGAHDNGDGHDHGHGHSHSHGAAFSGRDMWQGAITWKWAPDGNNSLNQIRATYERALVRRPNRYASNSDKHVADYLSVVWRFAPSWEAGVRTDALTARIPHGDHFHGGKLRETSVMLAWKPTHLQTLRIQATTQRNGGGFDTATNSLQLQYILSFGAHAAHSF